MRRALTMICVAAAVLFVCGTTATAHFGMIIPSKQMVMKAQEASLALSLMFWHPFEGQGMNLAKPERFGPVHPLS